MGSLSGELLIQPYGNVGGCGAAEILFITLSVVSYTFKATIGRFYTFKIIFMIQKPIIRRMTCMSLPQRYSGVLCWDITHQQTEQGQAAGYNKRHLAHHSQCGHHGSNTGETEEDTVGGKKEEEKRKWKEPNKSEYGSIFDWLLCPASILLSSSDEE